MHRFTLRQLEYLVATIDSGSIAAAAEQLGVSQPTISVALAKLEDQIGAQLLLRHHAMGVTATASADNILQSARSLLAHATDLQRQAVMTGTAVSGELRLGSFVTLAPAFLPGLIATLRREFPEITLRLSEGTQEQLIDGLYGGRLEMALIYDLGLPDEDGLTLIRHFREQHQLPIIILTGRGDTVDKIVGLELGADDYVTKPFDLRELLAKVVVQ